MRVLYVLCCYPLVFKVDSIVVVSCSQAPLVFRLDSIVVVSSTELIG
jgi:hypothetical protein